MDPTVPSGGANAGQPGADGVDPVSTLLDDWLASEDADGAAAAGTPEASPDPAPAPTADGPHDAPASLLDALSAADAGVPAIEGAAPAVAPAVAALRRVERVVSEGRP